MYLLYYFAWATIPFLPYLILCRQHERNRQEQLFALYTGLERSFQCSGSHLMFGTLSNVLQLYIVGFTAAKKGINSLSQDNNIKTVQQTVILYYYIHERKGGNVLSKKRRCVIQTIILLLVFFTIQEPFNLTLFLILI